MKFKNISEGTQVLIEQLINCNSFDDTWQVLSLGSAALPVSNMIANELNLQTAGIQVIRSFDEFGFQLEPQVCFPLELAEKLIICDIGVETGKTALTAANELTNLSGNYLTCFAAIVISKRAQPALELSFTQVVSARSPLISRDLRWEFEEFA